MMIVMKFRAVQEWQMITGMIANCCSHNDRQPKASCRYVTFQYQEAGDDRHNIAENVLNGMAVNRCQSIGRLMFVMKFVDPLVQELVMKQSVCVVKSNFLAKHTHD